MTRRNRSREPIPIPPPAPLPEPEDIDIPALLEQYRGEAVDLVVVLGPTASGKTRYAVSLARRLNALCGAPVAEILSADSRQVYRGMDIGTGKDLAEYGEIPYHLIDLVPAGTRYDLFAWQAAFEAAWREVRGRGGIPILCGGTGLYIQAATCGYRLPQIPPDEGLRAELEECDIEQLRGMLLQLRPVAAPGEEPADRGTVPFSVLQSKRRIIRAIEVARYEDTHPVQYTDYLPKRPYLIGTLVGREERNRRIDERLDARLQEGLVEEVKGLLSSGIAPEDLVYYGLEYKFVTQHVLGILSLEEMRVLLANAIHQFAKRQMTWFRGMERSGFSIHWTTV
ncbi:MAG: tRNA (adenosine(37)-N6)-dimethylallyltransferase MiaA [Bacteroidales bacterium]|nr:tRNA (adenosine(37)-N6)-dimethylallyltransferase MiaA [Bacteroidales bacterium]